MRWWRNKAIAPYELLREQQLLPPPPAGPDHYATKPVAAGTAPLFFR
jgi:hypothetical protein